MPQLDPTPWFTFLIFSWTTFLIILPPKVLAHTFPNEPTPISSKDTKVPTWSWQW